MTESVFQTAKFYDLHNASVFITGGGAGIGAALTEGFLQQGAKVAFVQRSECAEFYQAMTERYPENPPHFMQCDVTDTARLQACLQQASDKHGAITVLVNNAANDYRHDLMSLSAEQWNESMNVNLRPHFFTAQAVVPNMIKKGYGSIINLSSISYLMGNADYPAYVTAKAGITGLTRALAREVGEHGIRVNALLPGWVMTERQLTLWADATSKAEHLQKQCLKEHLAPVDIVGTALFLASKISRMITSQALVVDGGVVMTG